jgi:hypothetical protein
MDLYPHGIDYAWVAVDAVGHLGIFTNAGIGPIPASVLADRETADRAESLVEGLPERGSCEVLVSLPWPDYFVALGRRGIFAYDWQDVHRRANRTHCYEMLARPAVSVIVEELAGLIRALACRVRFHSLHFSESPCIAVVELVDCSPG